MGMISAVSGRGSWLAKPAHHYVLGNSQSFLPDLSSSVDSTQVFASWATLTPSLTGLFLT
jgi:hypothetical protein